jgi:phosphoribosylaminoimidazolecarboxamide formyltransferase/IMP cyclohydrolase
MSAAGAPRLALLSVSDKRGIVDFARGLVDVGFALLSTGGTAKLLTDAGLPVTEVAQHTGFPEMLDGRVKTLHPRVHGGLLARRDRREHLDAIAQAGIAPIDVLAVNLYPFRETVATPGCTFDEAIENIDIGGPAMVRAAAKNHGGDAGGVAVVTDPADYPSVLAALRDHGTVPARLRLALATRAFTHTARYDAAVSEYLTSLDPDAPQRGPVEGLFPREMHASFTRVQTMRYGENPHQQAAFYRDLAPAPGSLATYRQLQGKALSYNNIADADAAWECVRSFGDGPACVIVKHANPCGVARAVTPAEAYTRAFATDPVSAFGGVIAFNVPVDGEAARRVAAQFVEVLMAPAFDADARAVFADKAAARLLEIPLPPGGDTAWLRGRNAMESKRVGSGLLVQTADNHGIDDAVLRVVTRRAPTDAQMADLRFAWTVAKYVKSNAIVFCGDGRTLGLGAGQPSRLDSARIASIKAAEAGLSLAGSVVASDAFFPFRDGLDVVADAGASAVIQPGGSVRDDEVIAAADERGLAMVFTGVRHFRH